MNWQIFDVNEWVYPDTELSNAGARSINLETARGTYIGCQILLEGLPSNTEITWEYVSADSEFVKNTSMYQLIDVQVNENTGPDYSTVPVGTPADYVTRLAPFRVYDALKPVGEEFQARAEKDALYVCWKVDESANPHQHVGELRFHIDGNSYVVPVEIEVFKAKVAKEETLSITNWFSFGNIAKWHNLEKWSEPFWNMVYQYGEAMRRTRQTHFLVGMELVDIKETGKGSYEFDFSRVETLIKMFLGLGFTRIEGGHIAGRRGWDDSFFVLNYDTNIKATSPEGYTFISQYLSSWNKFLATNGWMSLTVQHIADEPLEESAQDYRVLAGIVRKFMPGVPLIDAIIHTELEGALDIWVPTNRDYDRNKSAYERIQAGGDTLWFYTCWNPGGHYMNRFLDIPLLKTRFLHWGNYLYKMDGYLHWGLNYYLEGQDPFELTNPMLAPIVHTKRVPAGDTHIVYPGTNGPWLSMRLESMRMGIEDYELLQQIAQADRKIADELVNSCMRSFTEANTDAAAFQQVHRRLLEAASI
ncbi:hypothetical protein BK120_12100 [Paenibacillus sp. FSL A5-0031]|uniref:DUF4091 domain-containing protein n=1 Tax=Paenibacillus sp. FSL A5-0031 TaxID=1920420 RepID=UPI00096E5691|nr:DUF4091 domain-containing protein [Paenibacillus sp. FSL A5-0031]OME85251.1 hypothetical protein BK120_12100 [Paenibacillus sp. FSL A5-0031]